MAKGHSQPAAKAPPPPLPAAPASLASPRLEWLVGLGALLAYLLATDLGTLLKGEVNSFGALLPPEKGIRGLYEMVYQLPPMLKMGADAIRQGLFPGWTPLPEFGTPLLGKMHHGLLNPLHIPMWVLPLDWTAYAFTLLVLLRSMLAFGATYLFGRRLGLSPWTAAAAGLVYAGLRSKDGLFSSGTGAALLPLGLYLLERYAQGERRLSPWLVPWAAALPFFAGHFEVALRDGAACALYAWFRLRSTEPPGRRLAAAWPLALGAAVGGLIAAVQALAGQDYLSASYNQVWRTLPEFGWKLRTCLKQLQADDAAPLVLGWAAGAAGLWLLAKPGLARLASVPALAVALALLGLVGLDDPLHYAARLSDERLVDWIVGPALLALAGWAALRENAPPGQRALGVVAACSLAVLLKLPPLSTILAKLPVVQYLNNTIYQAEFELAKLLLAGAALDAGLALWRLPWEERRRALAGPLAAAACLAAAVAAVPRLRAPLAFALQTHASSVRLAPDAGGWETPGRITTYSRSHPFVGWLKGSLPAAARLVTIKGEEPVTFVDAQLEASGAGWRFKGVLPLSEEIGHAALEVRTADGKGGVLPGPQINARKMPPGGFWAAAGSFLGACALPALGPAGFWAATAGLAAYGLAYDSMPSIPPEQFPYRLPGLDKVREDRGLHRVGSLGLNFMSADYPALYGFQDSRNGGDNLDPLVSIYFQFFIRGQLDDAKTRKTGVRLLGLANVKYFLEPPESDLKDADLERVYAGPEMSVYRNKRALPRAVFFEKHAVVPLGDLKQWRERGRVFGALAQATEQPGFDPATHLVLHEAPGAPNPTASPATAKEPTVEVTSYRADKASVRVDTPRAGLVFFSDNLLPGWTAELNGQAAPILPAWVAFRAVAVPAGRSTLEFAYRPLGLYGMALASFFAAWAWALGLLALRPWAKAPAPAAPSKKGAPPPPAPLPAWGPGELVLAGLAGADLLYWSWWAAWKFEGGLLGGLKDPGTSLLVNVFASAALLLGAVLLAKALRGETAAPPAPAPEAR